MLILAAARREAISARAPGRSSIESSRAGSSLERILAAPSAALARAGSLVTRRILPRPAASEAQTATMLTPALARASDTFARTPGLDSADTTIWTVFAMGGPPPGLMPGDVVATLCTRKLGRTQVDATGYLGGIRLDGGNLVSSAAASVK